MSEVDPAFAKFMVALAEAYPTVKLREGTIRMYFRALKDIPLPALKRAAERALKESDFFPSIALLRRGVEPTSDDAAVLQWTELIQAASSVGAYASVNVEDPCTARALVMVFGGWPQFCEVAGDNPATALKRQEFLAAYRDARRREQQEVTPIRLVGLCERGVVGRIPAGRLLPAPSTATPQLADRSE